MTSAPLQTALKMMAACASLTWLGTGFGQINPPVACSVQSGPLKTPVIELYTSEGCSSCPPADQWLSTFKTQAAGQTAGQTSGQTRGSFPVIQAFHVGYWDYIGWVDRFASPAYTTRQRHIAALNRQSAIYTPQAVLDGRDWPNWAGGTGSPERVAKMAEPAQASINLKQIAPDQFEALVTLAPGATGASGKWSAYWTITEDGHSSRVKSGENAGEFLKHDFVVRQYTPAGDYDVRAAAPQKLSWRSIAATPGHARRVNLVVFDPQNGKTLQAVSASCGA